MLVVQNPKRNAFVKMNGAGNDFVIFDARNKNFFFSPQQIKDISDRRNVGCDQFIIIKNTPEADCEMLIFNSDGTSSGACGNATRCVARIMFDEKENSSKKIKIKTQAGILECWQNEQYISVDMGKPRIVAREIFLFGFNFCHIDVGNPHAISIIDKPIDDNVFFKVGPQVENNSNFPFKTNVEFAQIIDNSLIEVRVWERGVGETLACGSGACAVGFFAIKNNLVSGNEVKIRFKGGDLKVELRGENIIMTGDCKKIFSGNFDESFLL